MGTMPLPSWLLTKKALSNHQFLLHSCFVFLSFIRSATSSTGLSDQMKTETSQHLYSGFLHTSLYFLFDNRSYSRQHVLNGFIPIHTFSRYDNFKGEPEQFGLVLGTEVTRTAAIGRCLVDCTTILTHHWSLSGETLHHCQLLLPFSVGVL